MANQSFEVIVYNGETVACHAEVCDKPFTVRDKYTHRLIDVNSGNTAYDVMCAVSNPDHWEHYMFSSKKPDWVDGNDYFSAIADKNSDVIYITICDGVQDLMTLPVSSIHGGVFYIYLNQPLEQSFSEKVCLSKMNTHDKEWYDSVKTSAAAAM